MIHLANSVRARLAEDAQAADRFEAAIVAAVIAFLVGVTLLAAGVAEPARGNVNQGSAAP